MCTAQTFNRWCVNAHYEQLYPSIHPSISLCKALGLIFIAGIAIPIEAFLSSSSITISISAFIAEASSLQQASRLQAMSFHCPSQCNRVRNLKSKWFKCFFILFFHIFLYYDKGFVVDIYELFAYKNIFLYD